MVNSTALGGPSPSCHESHVVAILRLAGGRRYIAVKHAHREVVRDFHGMSPFTTAVRCAKSIRSKVKADSCKICCQAYKAFWRAIRKEEEGNDTNLLECQHAGIVDLSQNAGYVKKLHTYLPTLKGPLAFTASCCSGLAHDHANLCWTALRLTPCVSVHVTHVSPLL